MTQEPTVLITPEQIHKRVKELGEAIVRDYRGKELLCVGVLKGSILFFADLIREIQLPLQIDFLGASSYGAGTLSSGVVKITLDLSAPIAGKHVLLIEDIVDTGLTIRYLMENLRLRKPASIKLCSLLLKPSRLLYPIPVDYLGFSIDDRFIVGYGLDDVEYQRNLPYLGFIDAESPPVT
ncbi:MAG: hypoxanthine phosphoribosyltransferase [Pseudomonadota bacterium]